MAKGTKRLLLSHAVVASVLCSVALVLAVATDPPAAAAAGTGCKNANIYPRPGKLKQAQKALLCLINKERTRNGLTPFHRDSGLEKAAAKHSRDMNKNRYFSSESPNGALPVDRAKKVGYGKGALTFTITENIYFSTGRYSKPISVFTSWIASEATKENILSTEYKDIGVGIAYGKPISKTPAKGSTYTVMFGVKKISEPITSTGTTPVL